MDFNTGGSSGRSDDRQLFGGEAGGPARGPAGGAGGEFNLQDPVNSFINVVRNLVLDPVGFFRAMPRRGNILNPLVFAVICAAISGILSGVIVFLLFLGLIGDFGGALFGLIYYVIGIPVSTAIGLFVLAGLLHLLVILLVRPSETGFEATFRVVCYASFVNLASFLALIPFLGLVIALALAVYNIMLNVLGIREVHSTSTGTAAAVVLIPVGVLLLIVLIFGVLFAILLSNLSPQL